MDVTRQLMAMVLLFTVIAPLEAADTGNVTPRVFTVQFEPGKPLVYQIEITTITTSSMTSDLRNVSSTTSYTVKMKCRLEAVSGLSNGVTTVSYRPYDIRGDWDIRNPSGHFVSTMRDWDFRGSQNGILLFDTAHDVGLEQAEKMRNAVVTVFLSGRLDFSPEGQITGEEGDLPFIKFWQGTLKTQNGFFDIIFPDRKLGTDDSWDTTTVQKTAGTVKLDGDGITSTNTYTCTTNDVVDGRPVVVFTSACSSDNSDLTGYMEQPGQNTSVDISSFDRDSAGVYDYDPERHVLVDGSVHTNVRTVMTSLLQGKATTVNTHSEVDMQFNLLSQP